MGRSIHLTQEDLFSARQCDGDHFAPELLPSLVHLLIDLRAGRHDEPLTVSSGRVFGLLDDFVGTLVRLGNEFRGLFFGTP